MKANREDIKECRVTKIRTLVVDDEPMAAGILGLLAQETDVEVIGECADGVEAVSAIQHRPGLVVPRRADARRGRLWRHQQVGAEQDADGCVRHR